MKKTTNMRAGFTMIELIFVIVIIGILAAIAMNKLSATRDDAKISQIIANTKTFINDAKSFYTAQGYNKWIDANTTVTDVTDVPLYQSNCTTQETNTSIVGSATTNKSFYLCANGNAIVKFDVNSTNLTASSGTGSDAITKAIKENSAFKAVAKTIRLGGKGVNFGN